MGRTQGGTQGVQKHKDYYKSERERLEGVVGGLAASMRRLRSANNDMLLRMRVLASLVIHQEQLAKLLHNLHVGGSSSSQAREVPDSHSAIPGRGCSGSHTADAGEGGGAASTTPAAEATTAAAGNRSDSGSSDSPHLSYCYQLLYNASPEQWQRAANMSAQDWCEYYSTICARLTLYKTMLARNLAQQQQQDAAAAMQQLVDDFLTLVMLTLTCNTTMAYRQASQVDLSTGRVVDRPPVNHWQRVIAGSNLSPAQESNLLLAFSYFVRQRSSLQARQQANSCQLAAAIERTQHTLSSDFAAGGSFTGSSSSSHSSGTGVAPAARAPAAAKASTDASPAATDDAEAAGQRLVGKFNAVLSGIDAANCVLLVHTMDVLTPPQRLHWVLSSYPFLPRPGALLEALSLAQQQAAQAQQQDAQAQQKLALQQQLQQLQQEVAETQQQAQQQQQHVQCASSSDTDSMADLSGLLSCPTSAASGPEPGLREHTQQIHLRQLQLAQQHQAFWARYTADLQELGSSRGLDVRSLLGLTG